jgi:5-oxopent-3-ene-1,2,5-tricarboxylate decarboxylase / 2-hydroxyhepta-2,4-diene-1,7-dioate isomerase
MSSLATRIAAVEAPPYGLSGAVYCALLNHRSALLAVGTAVSQSPYLAPPKAPVLYIKPRNTFTTSETAVPVPTEIQELEIGACLGLVIDRVACNVAEQEALEYVAGFIIVNDLSVPHSNYYRPSVSHRARDRFCPLGPAITKRASIGDPDALTIKVYVDGVLKQAVSNADLIRSTAKLVSDVTEFMTLSPGDVLATGYAAPAPRARAGQEVAVEIAGLGRLVNHLVAAPI